MRRVFVAATLAASLGVADRAQAAAITLGAFTFDSARFGDTLTQSDGGTQAANHWLNVVDADPGSPGYLTGANFDTGIANIGLFSGPVSYTIGYAAGIADGTGDDFGVVVARFSSDPFTIELSSDGVTFTAPLVVSAASGIAAGTPVSYFYNGTGPFNSQLFVHPLDIASFGLSSVTAIRITGTTELDLIRVAGFQTAAVPEPASLLLLGTGGLALAMKVRRRRARARMKGCIAIR